MPSRHGQASSLRGWRWRDASHHQLLAGELAVVEEDVQMMCSVCLWLLLHAWILDCIGWIWIKLNMIGLDWISEIKCYDWTGWMLILDGFQLYSHDWTLDVNPIPGISHGAGEQSKSCSVVVRSSFGGPLSRS